MWFIEGTAGVDRRWRCARDTRRRSGPTRNLGPGSAHPSCRRTHELILTFAREAAGEAEYAGDDGTNDLLVSDVIRANEMQVWFLSEHLVDVPVVEAE